MNTVELPVMLFWICLNCARLFQNPSVSQDEPIKELPRPEDFEERLNQNRRKKNMDVSQQNLFSYAVTTA